MKRKYTEIEREKGKPIKDVLRELYEKHGTRRNVQQAVADELGVSQPIVSSWIQKANLQPKVVLIEREKAS